MHRMATKVRKKRRADQKQDGWTTSGEQRVHNGRGTHKIGGNGRHLQRATFCSGWTKPPSNQIMRLKSGYHRITTCKSVSEGGKTNGMGASPFLAHEEKRRGLHFISFSPIALLSPCSSKKWPGKRRERSNDDDCPVSVPLDLSVSQTDFPTD
ncbi:hypothetical protein PoB_001468000 [Plakobranchus ocellatus]|uniref:Uncharacterized protein n=1 Tax=Plakobranchus ocellatus TaxID=259542 RepID=A0AAV3YYB0_9GAST|nr:hypothetical protein PoB_001468000 [Plakobranchus ocellatus]